MICQRPQHRRWFCVLIRAPVCARSAAVASESSFSGFSIFQSVCVVGATERNIKRTGTAHRSRERGASPWGFFSLVTFGVLSILTSPDRVPLTEFTLYPLLVYFHG